ncbi:hypothetical protein AgCh_021503 [Apium graveolens]
MRESKKIELDSKNKNQDLLLSSRRRLKLRKGITTDGYVAIANDSDLFKGACGKSLASFPQVFGFICPAVAKEADVFKESTKVVNRVVPAYHWVKVRGVLLHDKDDDVDI